jgi:hypothetical protein
MKELFARDQFGTVWGPLNPRAPKKSLLESTCCYSAQQMMIDTRTGTDHIGYVVSTPRGQTNLWCQLYWQNIEPWRKQA